jgi:nucleoside permease NupC
MLVFRLIVGAVALVLGGLAIAWMVTRDRKYLTIAWRLAQWALALGVLLALLYVFERVLLM